MAVIAGRLNTDVANSGSVAINYPPGVTVDKLATGALSHVLVVDNNDVYPLASGKFSASFGSSSVTITNSTGFPWLAGTYLSLQVADATISTLSSFDVVGDGVTDCTAALNRAIAALALAGGGDLRLPPGIYVVDGVLGASNVSLVGDNVRTTVLKRKAGAAANYMVAYLGKNNFRVSGITFDGNKANNSVGATCLTISQSCYSFDVEDCIFKDALNAAGYGNGITVSSSIDDAQNTSSRISRNRVTGCDSPGIYIATSAGNLSILDNASYSNGDSGIQIENNAASPQPDTIVNLVIARNHCFNNDGSGIAIKGFRVSGTASAPVYGNGFHPVNGVILAENSCHHNDLYGIVVQAKNAVVKGNTCRFNGGNGTVYAGILANAEDSLLEGNICEENAYFGIDAGGMERSIIKGNHVRRNGVNSSGANGSGISVGAAQHVTVEGNFCEDNGSTTGGYQLYVPRGDSASAVYGFPLDARYIRLLNNVLRCANTNQRPLVVVQDVSDVTVKGNIAGGSINDAMFVVESNSCDIADNAAEGYFPYYSGYVLNSTTLVPPDGIDYISVSPGSQSTIALIRPYSVNRRGGTITAVKLTNRGSGYTSNPTVVFTGGGGSGAAATAWIQRDGTLANVFIDNYGSGYNSVPTISFTGGGGTGAAATASLQLTQQINGRIITLRAAGSITVTHSTNIRLAGGVDYSMAAGDHLVLRGYSGSWVEIGRGKA